MPAVADTPDRYRSSATPAPEAVVYTVEEVAELLRIGRSAAYEAVRRGQIPALRLGRRLRIPRSALDQLLRIHTSLERQNEKTLISDDGCER